MKEYMQLFKEISKSAETIAESVLEMNMKKGADEDTIKRSQDMRNTFADLTDKISSDNKLTIADIRTLNIEAIIVAMQIEKKKNGLETVLSEYRTKVIPNLTDIIRQSKSDDNKIEELLNEKFEN